MRPLHWTVLWCFQLEMLSGLGTFQRQRSPEEAGNLRAGDWTTPPVPPSADPVSSASYSPSYSPSSSYSTPPSSSPSYLPSAPSSSSFSSSSSSTPFSSSFPPTSSTLSSSSSTSSSYTSSASSSPSPPFSSTVPSGLATPEPDRMDPDGSEAALAFLDSGDAFKLSHANCSRRFEMRSLEGGPQARFHSFVRSAADTLVHATNFLNMIFQTNDIRESSIQDDVEWYHALVRSILEGDRHIYRATLTFDAHPMSSRPQLMLQATKDKHEILLQDLTAAESVSNLSWDQGFTSLKFQRNPSLTKTILSNDLKSLDTPKWNKGDSYVMNHSQVRWSTPFLECEQNTFLPSWMVTLSAAFYGLKPDLSPEFKGVIRLEVKLQSLDINQCSSGPGWFTDTHRCDLNSTQCIAQEGLGFVLGGYLCLCRPGFYGTRRTLSSRQASTLENTSQFASQYGAENVGGLLACRPCQAGCVTCVDDSPCFVQEDWSLRAAILAFQAFCMLAVFISMLVSYHFRKSKRIRASGVILLETILFGSLLLYFPVFILYFKPSIFRCLLLRWVRMLGFAIVYGTITLKLYRVLKVFLSRTAQRVPYMTSARVLKMLAVILLLVLWFLVAWTVGMMENMDRNIPLVVRSQTPGGLYFYICDHDRWDYMMVVAELLFLCWGSFLCYATRTVPSAFHEPRYMGVALHNEMVISATFHVVRFLMVPTLHPDWTLLLFFIHTHVTITLTLALLFIPKFLHAGSPLREEIAAEVYEDELDLRRSGSYLNSSITSAWSEHSLDPDDIRDELKKLYAQLEVHKTKKMTTNNPHLQKKRSSRRGLGRSIMRRITEIPDSVSRQHSRDEKDSGSGTGSYPGSYKKKTSEAGSSSVKVKDESLKHKVFSLKKSHSTYDHVRDQKEHSPPRLESSCKDASLRDSLMRKKLAKKASQKSNNDSMDEAPLVYKSVSAHNLLTEKRPLHPKGSNLQKSLSVLTSTKEKALLVTGRAFQVGDSCQLVREKEGERMAERGTSPQPSDSTISQGAIKGTDQAPDDVKQPGQLYEGVRSSLLAGSFDKSEVCPWELQDLPSAISESKTQKHVTYAPIKCSSVDTSHLSGKLHDASSKPAQPTKHQSVIDSLDKTEVCPWEYQEPAQTPDHPPSATTESPPAVPSKPQTPQGMEPCRKAEDACANETFKKGVTKEASTKDKKLSWSPMAIRVRPGAATPKVGEIGPREGGSPAVLPSLHKVRPFGPRSTSEDIGGTETAQRSISPMKTQSLKELPQKKTLKGLVLAMRAFKGPILLKADSTEKDRRENEACLQKGNTEANARKEKLNLAEICPWDTEMAQINTSAEEVSNKIPKPVLEKANSKHADIGLHVSEETKPSHQKNHSIKTTEVCPWEENGRQANFDQDHLSLTRVTNKEEASLVDTGNISPMPKVQKQSSIREMVCPWESLDEQPENQISRPRDQTADSAASVESKSKKEEVCPCENLDREDPPGQHSSSESKSILQSKGMSKTSDSLDSKRGDICPWESLDSEEPPGTLSKSGSRSPDQGVALKKSDSTDSRRGQICPWELINEDPSIKAEVCPWELGDPLTEINRTSKEGHSAFQSRKGTRAGKDTSRNSGGNTTPRKLERVSSQRDAICPWESLDSQESPGILSPSTSKLFDQGPVILKASDSLDSKRDEVCPWESVDSEEPLGTLSKSGSRTSEQGVSLSGKSDSRREEICPWEALEEKNSIKVEVCPWETESVTATITKQKTTQESSHLNLEDTPTDQLQEGGSAWECEDTMPLTKSLSKSEEKMRDLCGEGTQHSKRFARKWNYSLNKKTSDMAWEEGDTQSIAKKARLGIDEVHTQTSLGPLSPTDTQRPIVCQDPEGTSSVQDQGSPKIHHVDTVRATICPWEVLEEPTATATEEGSQGPDRAQEVCPWEASEDHPTCSPTGKSNAAEPPKGDVKMPNTTKKPEVCPWDFE
ncbi:probable G-protein coupled receptor 179 [Ambystoma mexicanum]|uniref:probable G-protein coupled receptor 179 n=1 Tax=Ambystoma mexicanum TaxID=8296 RepID=UPI0037E847F3